MDHLWCSNSMSSQQYSKRSSPTGSASLWDRPATLHLAQGQTGVQRLQVFPFNKHSSCNHLLWPWLYIISIPNIIWLYRVDVKRRLNAPYQKEQVHVSSASSHSDTFSCLESTCEAAEGSEAGGVRRSNGQCHQQVFKDCCFVVTRIHYYKRTSCSGNKDWKTWTGSSKSWRSTTSLFLKR